MFIGAQERSSMSRKLGAERLMPEEWRDDLEALDLEIVRLGGHLPGQTAGAGGDPARAGQRCARLPQCP
uniref:Uncharacterized protein n=1 Tax=Ralstonia solanacearum CFBP2957 TaxID=859656 RepID=D8P416_RALSL|nr:protein of unknown function [Ralstonia solanacearum CFBP2957]